MIKKDITYIITISNGVSEEKRFVDYDGEWVTDEASAISMVEAQLNKAWKIVQ